MIKQNEIAMIWILIGIFSVVVMYHGVSAMDDLDAMQTEYCEMTQLFQEANGQLGWPDYRGNAAEVCK